jgi:hypothetical protein
MRQPRKQIVVGVLASMSLLATLLIIDATKIWSFPNLLSELFGAVVLGTVAALGLN